jgi:hypothetical protein
MSLKLALIALTALHNHLAVRLNAMFEIQYSDWLQAGRPGFDFRQGHCVKTGFQAFCTAGTKILSPWVKRSEHEADNSSSSSADVKNAWSFAIVFPYVWRGT